LTTNIFNGTALLTPIFIASILNIDIHLAAIFLFRRRIAQNCPGICPNHELSPTTTHPACGLQQALSTAPPLLAQFQ
jgi:hypothetical protein